MKELITEQQAHVLVLWLCITITAAGILWAFLVSRSKESENPRLVWLQGLLAALAGPVLFLLWNVYNAIEDHYGLDSVKALLINLVLFLAVGVLFAYVFSRLPSLASSGGLKRKR